MAQTKKGPGRPKGSKNKTTNKKTQTTAKKTTAKKDGKQEKMVDPNRKEIRSEAVIIVLIAIGVFLAVSMHTKICGAVGVAISSFLKGLFGLGAYFLPYCLIVYAILTAFGATKNLKGSRIVWGLVLYIAMDLINAARFVKGMEYGILGMKEVYEGGVALDNGGVVGMYLGSLLYKFVGMAGLYIVAIVMAIVGLLFLINIPLSTAAAKTQNHRAKRKEEKAEKKRIAKEEAEARAKEAAEKAARERELEEKRLAVLEAEQAAARSRERVPAAEQADPAKPHRFTANRDRVPKLQAGSTFTRLSDNKRNILEMVMEEDSFGPTKQPAGFGLDGTEPDSISQPTTRKTVNVTLYDAQTGKKYSTVDFGSFKTVYGPDGAEEIHLIEMDQEEYEKLISRYNSDLPLDDQPKETDFVAITPEDIDRETVSTEPEDEKQPEEGDDRVVVTPGPIPTYEDTFDPHIGSELVPPLKERRGHDTIVSRDPDAVKEPDGMILRHSAHKANPTIGGASTATAASITESGEAVVEHTKKQVDYRFPPINLLTAPKGRSKMATESALQQKAQLLEDTLASFGVEATVTNVISGPSVTRFEVEPGVGVKVSRITGLEDDIALNMKAKSLRMEAPIPGKAAVGIEIENEERQMVHIREILDSDEFKNFKSRLAFAVGRDIGGKPVVADLAKMPHMLIAGATGSGKSVCINTIIMSFLYKADPKELKLLLVDPKRVELGNYNGIPHLIHPVVTDPNKAAGTLQWAVAYMMSRYDKFAEEGVKDLGSYNAKMKKEGREQDMFPQLVIIIDELADLMMVASSAVEEAIARLAQLARAAGIHMILATQRPSVDVITGLIKANVPSRIAFMVSSQIDSRTIIDMAGAEKLVGNGDMLYKPQDMNKPKRIQGPFVSDEEIEKVLNYVKKQKIEVDEDLSEAIENFRPAGSTGGSGGGMEEEEDDLIMDALEVCVSAGSASVSMLQRRFRIGYNRAARLIDAMEDRGFIGPSEGSKPRQVRVTEEELEQLKETYRL